MGTSIKFGTYTPPVSEENKDKILIYLLFYVNGNKHGDTFFAEAAQTRLNNIKNSRWYNKEIHKVHCPPIQDVAEVITIIKNYISKYGGKEIAFCKEIGIFSHAALDGPIGSKTCSICPEPIYKAQMLMCGWEKIEFNWSEEYPMCVFYGCNSANEKPIDNLGNIKSFAKNISMLSNFLGVEVWGQSTSSFPSFYPDYRVTSMGRNMGIGWDMLREYTYQVGGNPKEGWEATSYDKDKDELDYDELKKFPEANPLNCYKNGVKFRETHQGYFNDHRKNK